MTANAIPKEAEHYITVTDAIFSVLVSFSFVEYSSFIVRPDILSIKFVMLFFAYSLVTISRLGYHNSATTRWYKNGLRFLIDLWILYGYFVLLNAPGPTQFSSSQSVALEPDVGLMVLGQFYVFAGYLVWDVVKKLEWPESEPARMKITVKFYFVSSITLVLYSAVNSTGQMPVVVTAILIGLSYIAMFGFWYFKLIGPFIKRLRESS